MPSARDQRVWLAAPWVALVAGAALLGRTLRIPFWRDDLLQRAMVVGGFPADRGPLDLYDFVRAGERARFVDLGVLPWWTDETYRIRFFRPLASLVLWLEHRFVGSAPVMHALSLAWWAGAVLAVAWLFRRALAPRAAAIATLVFAVAPCHVPALALIAQREVLVTVMLGAIALGLLAPPEPSRRARLASSLLFAGALAAGEYGLCFAGYALALAVWAPSRRARAALPYAIPAVAYLTLRAALGYGSVGSGFYRDPVTAPWRFLVHAPRALFVLVTDVWSTFDAEAVSWPWLLAGALGVIALLALSRSCPMWLRIGSVVALVPVLGAAPGQRLVAPALVGVAACVGVLAECALARPRSALGLAAAVLLGLHLAHAPLATFEQVTASLDHARSQADRELDLAGRSKRADAIGVIALASWGTAFFGAVVPGEPNRMPWRVLVNARHALVLRRDARTLDVVVPKGQGFFPAGTDDIFRPEDHPLAAGDVRDVPGLHVEVLGDGAQAPRIRFTFDRALDDPSFVWLSEKREGYVAIQPPARGYGLQLTP